MEKTSKEFLFDLLRSPSPSGDESRAQKIWMNYVKQFAEVKTDEVGNAYGILNPNAAFKVMLAAHIDEIAMIVTKIDERGYVWFTNSGWLNPKMLPGMKVDIYGYSGKTIKGIIQTTAEKEANATIENCFIDCGYNDDKKLKKLVRIGDYAVYESEPQTIGENKIVSKALDNKTGAYIIAEVIKKLSKKKLNIAVYAISTTGEETNSRGAFTAAARIKPNMALACDVTFDSQHPGANNSNGQVTLGKGGALSIGSPINRKIDEIFEKTAKKKKIPYQLEITADRTHTDADRIMYSGEGVPVALVSLPVKYMHSPSEMADLNDLDKTVELIAETLAQMTGKEDLRPVKP